MGSKTGQVRLNAALRENDVNVLIRDTVMTSSRELVDGTSALHLLEHGQTKLTFNLNVQKIRFG